MGTSPESNFIAGIAEHIAELAYQRLAAKLSQPEEPLAYSIDQAAKKLCLSRSTLKTIIREREIAVVRRGTRVLITKRALENWLERNET